MPTPDYSLIPNYGGRSIQPVAPRYNAWLTALVAVLIGRIVSFIVGFVLGFLGIGIAIRMGATHQTPGAARILILLLIGYLVVIFTVAIAQAMYVGSRGGARPFVACLGAGVVGELLSWFAAPTLAVLAGTWGSVLIVAGIQIVMIALLTQPSAPAPQRPRW